MTHFNAPLHTDIEARNKVWEMIKDIPIATLVTQDEDGRLYSRPMGAHQKDFDGKIWLVTSIDSPKVKAIQNNSHVLLNYSEPKSNNFVSINGSAHISQDRKKIDELWNEVMRIWFPEGKDDPHIGLISVTVEEAEYWDSPSSMFVPLIGYAKAALTGEAPKMGENERVLFQARR